MIERLELVPMTLREARTYVAQRHRHHRPPQGGLFAVACARGDDIVGCAIIGNPVARMLDDDWTVELTRLCTDGSKNACSFLYGASWRAAKALGYRRAITYTLKTESGASLRGAGWTLIGERGGGTWNRKSRPRIDTHPLEQKLLWQVSA